jgi:hypothetical protein
MTVPTFIILVEDPDEPGRIAALSPAQYEMVNDIVHAMMNHDIKAAEGQRQIIERLADLDHPLEWGNLGTDDMPPLLN